MVAIFKQLGDPVRPLARGGHNRSLPTGRKIARILRTYFKLQRQEVQQKIGPRMRGAIKLSHWDEPMAKTLKPLIAEYWRDGAIDAQVRIQRLASKKGYQRTKQPEPVSIGFDIFNPQTLREIEKHTYDFVRSTNNTSSSQLNDTIAKLRQELSQGLASGEALKRLTERVQGIFADPSRSLTIAATEASRALHAGQRETARQSEVVKGLKWLASSDACPLCSELNGQEISLEGNFAVDAGGGPYAAIPYPPRH